MANYNSYRYFRVTFPVEYVAHVEINRPEKMNSFLTVMFEELRHVFTQLSYDPAIRAVVLSGSGDRAFTAGLDVREAAEMEGGLLSMSKPSTGTANSFPDVGRIAVHLRRYVDDFQNCISSIERCEKPVVAAMHGHALGLAIDLATAADVRMCTHSTQLAVKEVDIGMAADMGTLSRLPKVVNHAGWVKEVAMTGRTFGAREALRVGLVNYAYETKAAMVQAALTLASLLASKSPIAVQGIKEILNYSRDHPVQDGLRYTNIWNSSAVQATDLQVAVLSGLQKKTPTFEKL